MTFNYSFEVAAAVLMLLLIAIMLIHRDVDLAKGRAFFAFVISSVIESITNVLSAWGLEHTEVVWCRVQTCAGPSGENYSFHLFSIIVTC